MAQARPLRHLERVANNLYALLPGGLCHACQSNGKTMRVLFCPVFKQKDGGLHMAAARVRGGTDSAPLGSRGGRPAGLTVLPSPPSPLRPQSPGDPSQGPCGCLPAGRASVQRQLPHQLHRTPNIPTVDAQILAFPGTRVFVCGVNEPARVGLICPFPFHSARLLPCPSSSGIWLSEL